MPAAEQRAFVEDGYATYRRLVRHTPPAYADAASRLAAGGRLTLVHSRVTAVTPAGPVLRVAVAGAPPLDAAAVFDCRGFVGVRDTDNPVVRALVAAGTAEPNRCGRGLRVNPRLEAAPGLFVLGQVLAGTSHPGAHIWSLENIARIHALAEPVAGHLWTAVRARVRGG
jgi:uncharacterized NAD(P)/FAD-binding protein YdhS